MAILQNKIKLPNARICGTRNKTPKTPGPQRLKPHSVEIYNPKQFSNIGCNLSCPLFEKNERRNQTQQYNFKFRWSQLVFEQTCIRVLIC